jgi:hypothetical protein
MTSIENFNAEMFTEKLDANIDTTKGVITCLNTFLITMSLP